MTFKKEPGSYQALNEVSLERHNSVMDKTWAWRSGFQSLGVLRRVKLFRHTANC